MKNKVLNNVLAFASMLVVFVLGCSTTSEGEYQNAEELGYIRWPGQRPVDRHGGLSDYGAVDGTTVMGWRNCWDVSYGVISTGVQ